MSVEVTAPLAEALPPAPWKRESPRLGGGIVDAGGRLVLYVSRATILKWNATPEEERRVLAVESLVVDSPGLLAAATAYLCEPSQKNREALILAVARCGGKP